MSTAAAAAETATAAPRGTSQGSSCQEKGRHLSKIVHGCLSRPAGHLRFLQPPSTRALRLPHHGSGHGVHLESGLRVPFARGTAGWASGLGPFSDVGALRHDLRPRLCFLLLPLGVWVAELLFQRPGSLPFSHGAPVGGPGSQPPFWPLHGALTHPVPHLPVRPELWYLQPCGQLRIQGPHRHLEIHLQPHGPPGLQGSECLEVSDLVEDSPSPSLVPTASLHIVPACPGAASLRRWQELTIQRSWPLWLQCNLAQPRPPLCSWGAP